MYDPNSSLKFSMGLPPIETGQGRIDLIMDVKRKIPMVSQPAQEQFYKAYDINYYTMTQADAAQWLNTQFGTHITFWADRYRLSPVECTTLHWSVTEAREVYLNGEGVAGQDAGAVCPVATATYVLRVIRTSGTTQEYRLTIVVGDEVTLWNAYQSGSAEEQTLAELIRSAEAQFPDLTINVLQIPFDQIFSKYQTEVAAGGGPE